LANKNPSTNPNKTPISLSKILSSAKTNPLRRNSNKRKERGENGNRNSKHSKIRIMSDKGNIVFFIIF
jgi:hypothetical protein